MEEWNFSPRKLPVITPVEASRILENKPKYINVSLGKHRNILASYNDNSLSFSYMGKSYNIPLSELHEIANEPVRRIFVLHEGSFKHLAWSSDRAFYQLISVNPNHAPTLEINGVHMHRIQGILPFKDARQKVLRLRIKPGMKVLDICTGLGYTAIWESRLGGHVTSIEIDENVLLMAEFNPWSEELESVRIILDDASHAVTAFEEESFHRILSDPPRFSFAGELYSGAFFKELFRILKPRGILYHYTGKAGERTGKSFVKGVLRRVRDAGFLAHWDSKTQGIIGIKPRR